MWNQIQYSMITFLLKLFFNVSCILLLLQVATVGCVMAGLVSPNEIPAESMEGVTLAIVQCLPPYFLQVTCVFKFLFSILVFYCYELSEVLFLV